MSNVTVQEALKSAIEALNYVDNRAGIVPPVAYEKIRSTLNQCKAALSEIEKYEPVGEVVMVQEPEWIKPHEGFKWYQTEFPLGTKFYTSPISKEWVGLSYEEVESLYDGGSWHEFANAISEKLKQLNTKG